MPQPLQVNNLTKRFDSFTAVDGISFSVAEGEVVGIVGPNGAGKTTTIKMILDLIAPDTGTIELFGKTMADLDIRQLIGYMPETPSFYHHLNGPELLSLVGKLFGLSTSAIRERSTTLLERVGLQDAANRPLGTYSKGMLQRICLAQALINQPKLLFLDEPLDGLDPLGRVRMKEVLLDIKSTGTAIVLNSHILSDVEVMSDRIAIMDRGRILRLEPVKKLIPHGKSLEEVFISTIESSEA